MTLRLNKPSKVRVSRIKNNQIMVSHLAVNNLIDIQTAKIPRQSAKTASINTAKKAPNDIDIEECKEEPFNKPIKNLHDGKHSPTVDLDELLEPFADLQLPLMPQSKCIKKATLSHQSAQIPAHMLPVGRNFATEATSIGVMQA